MLTNFSTVHKRLQRLKDLEAMETSGEFAGRTKKEVLLLTREKDKLAKTLGGIRDMARVPSAVWIVDTKKEHIAVGEARKLHIPVVAILDTNCDPDEVDYKIPGNDDAIRSVALLTRVVADAVADGLMSRSGAAAATEGAADAAVGEPLAAWEQDILVGDAAPAAPVAVESAEPAEPAEPVAAEPVAAIAESEPTESEPTESEPAETEPAAEAPAAEEPQA
jgi:small subunit ribosomal protein S2